MIDLVELRRRKAEGDEAAIAELAELERRLDFLNAPTGARPPGRFTLEDLVDADNTFERMESQPRLARRPPGGAEPRHVGAAMGGDDRSRSSAAAGVDQMLPVEFRKPARRAPHGVTYRQRVKRRHANQKPSPSPWWLRSGTHSRDVRNWITLGHKSVDPVERSVVAALKKAVSRGGEIVDDLWCHEFPVVALAFVLWYSSERTARQGYGGCVINKPRGELARLSAHRVRGLRTDADTVSRYLTRLKELLKGLLDFHQPSPRDAERWKLPSSTHYLEDGRRLKQALNVYWWRAAAYVEKNGTLPPGTDRTFGADHGTGYVQGLRSIEPSRGYAGSSVSRAPPTTEIRRPLGASGVENHPRGGGSKR